MSNFFIADETILNLDNVIAIDWSSENRKFYFVFESSPQNLTYTKTCKDENEFIQISDLLLEKLKPINTNSGNIATIFDL